MYLATYTFTLLQAYLHPRRGDPHWTVPVLAYAMNDGDAPEYAIIMPRMRPFPVHDPHGPAPLPPFKERLTCVTRLAAIVRHLHSKGVLHGDIKPANIVLKPGMHDAQGWEVEPPQLLLSDLGSAILLRTGTVAPATRGDRGTPGYRHRDVAAGTVAYAKVRSRGRATSSWEAELTTRMPPNHDTAGARCVQPGCDSGGDSERCPTVRGWRPVSLPPPPARARAPSARRSHR